MPYFEYGFGVEAHFVAQALGIERPAFRERNEEAVAPEGGRLRELLRARDLQVMPGHRFVQHQRLHAPLRAARKRVDVRLEIAGAPGLGRTAHVVLGVVAFLRTHGANAIGQARQHGEEARQHCIGPLRDVAVALEHVVGTRVEELRVLVQEGLELGACALESRGRDRFVHRLADARDLGEPEIVDLARRELRRRVEREPRLVVAATRRQCRGRDVACRDGQVALVVELAQLAERRNQRPSRSRAVLRPPGARARQQKCPTETS